MKTAKKTPAQRAREALSATPRSAKKPSPAPEPIFAPTRLEIPASRSIREEIDVLRDSVHILSSELTAAIGRIKLLESHTMETADAILSGHKKVAHIVRYHMARR